MPLSSSTPVAAASSTPGSTPTPITAKSHSIVRPALVTTRSTRFEPSNASTESPKRSSTPFSRWISASTPPTSSPSRRSKGALPGEAGDVRAAVAGAGRDQHLLVLQALTVRELDDPRSRVEPHGADAKPGLDVVFGVEVERADESLLEGDLAAQVLLRKRRPLVGKVKFLADEDDPPLVALLAQRHRGRRPGEARADDDIRLRRQISTEARRSRPVPRSFAPVP